MPPLLAFARARPEVIRISEIYSYVQEISHLASLDPDSVPYQAGEVEVVIPYDGYQFFSSQSLADVVGQLGTLTADHPAEALIGHLTVASFGRTRLSQNLGLEGSRNSVPIKVPVAGEVMDPKWLGTDRRTCVLDAVYEIIEPDIWPIAVDIKIKDEDILNPSPDQSSPCANASDLLQIGDTISRQLNARGNLRLVFVVTATVLGGPLAEALTPSVSRFGLSWPVLPSLRSVQLFVGEGDQVVEMPIRYDPIKRRLEWRAVPMTLQRVSEGAGLLTFRSPPMELRIYQPGDLYPDTDTAGVAATGGEEGGSQEKLLGDTEVEISGWLFSGLDVRYFDGLGRLDPQVSIQRTTKLRNRFHVVLDDVFSERVLSPRQHLFFDQVIPDGMRWLDIEGALNDRGFQKEDKPRIEESDDSARYACCAKRSQGQHTLWLGLVADGRRHSTRRETQIPGGQRYTSIIESGELKVHLAGEMPGNSQALTEEMNALQAALRERFDRLKSMR